MFYTSRDICFIPHGCIYHHTFYNSNSTLFNKLFIQMKASPSLLFIPVYIPRYLETIIDDYFNQRLGCAAPRRWSKYTTFAGCRSRQPKVGVLVGMPKQIRSLVRRGVPQQMSRLLQLQLQSTDNWQYIQLPQQMRDSLKASSTAAPAVDNLQQSQLAVVGKIQLANPPQFEPFILSREIQTQNPENKPKFVNFIRKPNQIQPQNLIIQK